jgi:hypothetical protein
MANGCKRHLPTRRWRAKNKALRFAGAVARWALRDEERSGHVTADVALLKLSQT